MIRTISLIAVAFVVASAHRVLADFLPVYGTPAYDTATATGYRYPQTYPRSTGNGFGVTSLNKTVSGIDYGFRAFRFEAGGSAIELANLGVNASGSTFSAAYACNDAGTAVGGASQYDTNGNDIGSRAVRWNSAGNVTPLDSLGTGEGGLQSGYALDVNAGGTAVGDSLRFNGNVAVGQRATRWNAGGTAATELDHLGLDANGSTQTQAFALNNAGTVVGSASKFDGGNDVGTRAVRWNAGGTAVVELSHLGTDTSGKTYCSAGAVDDAGDAFGYALTYNGDAYAGTFAMRWNAGGTAGTQLDDLGHDGTTNTSSTVSFVNGAGTAVGQSSKFNGSVLLGYRPARWAAGGTAIQELDVLGTDANGYTNGTAACINASGLTVGFVDAYTSDGTSLGRRAVMWNLDGSVVDLNTLIDPASGWLLTYAASVSDTGWVNGNATFTDANNNSYERGFLLNVSGIPEPTGMTFLGMAVGWLGGRRRA